MSFEKFGIFNLAHKLSKSGPNMDLEMQYSLARYSWIDTTHWCYVFANNLYYKTESPDIKNDTVKTEMKFTIKARII